MTSPQSESAIIISTGRCGSTLLSDLIAEQADILSVQEFFGWGERKAYVDRELSGNEYWARLAEPDPHLSTLFRIGLRPKEVVYSTNGRWANDLANLPEILAMTLPKLSDDPDVLFDTLSHIVPEFPTQQLGRHHQMFLDLLTSLTGRQRWVERSGGSSRLAPYLFKTFPLAKFVHLTRNLTDTARSMSRHPIYQIAELRNEVARRHEGFDLLGDTRGQSVPEEVKCYLPDRLTMEILQERGQDIARFLTMCAFSASQAEQAIADAQPRRLLCMTYEDLVDEPVVQLRRLGRFLEFPDYEEWAHRVAERVAVPAARQGQ
ncbi:sulfotransferase [Micromonospora sp. WMMA1363]|uniref:sulfotransferase n=1 Tax=Micromonospora sp. WMMA1363 TaxID=3053985 RepID=UPI00259D1A2E|nr:sulfotransferase [Micromonospora sp. WMMA1363]MDM4721116.1 sulfotransferase [Micromonospora sp. WMMA1363]